jgi:hypothetical protein
MLTEIISNITGAFSELMTSMTSAIGDGFSALLLTDDGKLSNLAQFGLVFIGVGLAIGLVWFVVGLIRK